MEADWEIEIGGDAPVIDARWAGFVDLRLEPERAARLPEASELPELADALVRLNAADSPVWTSKCDVWKADRFDSDEMDAPAGKGVSALACYIDLLPRNEREWRLAAQALAACKALCGRLLDTPLRSSRADLIVRRACARGDEDEHGVTAYIAACGSTVEEARATLGRALGVFVDCAVRGNNHAAYTSTLQ